MTTDKRRTFAKDHGWSSAHVAAAIEGVPWLRRDAVERAQAQIEAVFTTGAASIRAWARDQGVPADRALRNLISGAAREDLDQFRLLLATVRVLDPEEQSEEDEIRAALGPPAGTPAAQAVAAGQGAAGLSEAHIEALLQGAPRRLAEWRTRCHALANPDAPAVDRVIHALRSSQGQRVRFRLQLVKRSLHVYPAPDRMTDADFHRFEPADLALMLRWPHLLATLTGRRDQELEALERGIQGWRTERWTAACHDLVADIQQRTVRRSTVRALLADPAFEQLPNDVLRDLRDAFASITAPVGERPPASTLDPLLTLLPVLLAYVARFVFGETPEVIARNGPRAVLETIAGTLDPALLVGPLGSGDPHELDSYLAALTAARKDRAVIELLTAERGADDPMVRALFSVWAGATDLKGPLRERVLAAAAGPLPVTAPAIRNLATASRRRLGTTRLLELLGSPSALVAFRAEDRQATATVCLRLIDGLRMEGWQISLPDGVFDLAAALELAPGEIVDALIDSGEILDPDVCRHVPSRLLLSRIQGPANAARFETLLTRAGTPVRPLPASLYPMLAASPAALAMAVERAGPSLSPQARVEIALRSPVAGRFFDRITTPEDRIAALEHVRSTFSGHPAVAAAYEVATAFSFAYAPYLGALAIQVRVPAADAPRGRQFDHLYHTYGLPKQSGGTRTITAPARGLKGTQRMLLANAFNALPLEDAATGFRPGRSIKDNAAAHTGQALVVNVDIDSFFPNTPYDHILRVTRKLAGGQLSERAARFIADICSYQGALPTGAPTSPVIANLVLTGVDRALTTAAARRDVHYTRYADDLTFSGGDAALRMVPFARRLLRDLGYTLDRKKTNIFRRGRRQMVTGLVVNEKADVPRAIRRRLRAAVHRRSLGQTPEWHGKPMDDATLRGWLSFLAMLRPDDAQAAIAALAEVRARERRSPEPGDA